MSTRGAYCTYDDVTACKRRAARAGNKSTYRDRSQLRERARDFCRQINARTGQRERHDYSILLKKRLPTALVCLMHATHALRTARATCCPYSCRHVSVARPPFSQHKKYEVANKSKQIQTFCTSCVAAVAYSKGL